jgi:hypothetical protein
MLKLDHLRRKRPPAIRGRGKDCFVSYGLLYCFSVKVVRREADDGHIHDGGEDG